MFDVKGYHKASSILFSILAGIALAHEYIVIAVLLTIISVIDLFWGEAE
jgi:hypothetical protein